MLRLFAALPLLLCQSPAIPPDVGVKRVVRIVDGSEHTPGGWACLQIGESPEIVCVNLDAFLRELRKRPGPNAGTRSL